MKLLVVGSGGREHAIAKKLLESKDVEQVFVAPGNDGIRLDGLDLINIGISEHSRLIDFAKANDVAWTFIGPDDALAAGIVDDFNALQITSNQIEHLFVRVSCNLQSFCSTYYMLCCRNATPYMMLILTRMSCRQKTALQQISYPKDRIV